jgi:hypothetical protein
LSESGVANKEEEFTYLDGTTNATGRFSNWNEVMTPMRRRVKGSDGTYSWERVNTADPEQININQLDLPIQNGEQIEIQIKSISEAGFPTNPMESDWSNPVIVAFADFPELQGDDISEIIAQNRVDASVANVVENMTGNTYAHMSSSFYTNDKYFAHNAESITSGFLSPEQTPITLYDKLYDLQNQITIISEQIEKVNATLEVKLIDGEDNTKIYTLNEGSTTYINAGNYLEDKNKIDANKRNGAIITKTYYIDISSDIQSGLEILSKIPGDRLSMCPNTITEVNNIISEESKKEDNIKITRNDYKNYDNILTPNSIASDYYKVKGRYDLVPINLSASDIIDYQICSPNMYQSAQCKGQFIYSRFRNVSDTFDMYANVDNKGVASFNPNADFILSEKTYKFNNDITSSSFWTDRFNLYRPANSGKKDVNGNLISDGYVTDRTEPLNREQKENLFNHILELYNNLTGSALSPDLYHFRETSEIFYMWKYTGTSTGARNIITNVMPPNENITIKGLYYKDINNDFDIYAGETKNYTSYEGYDNGVLKWKWIDGDIEDVDEFILDESFYFYQTSKNESGNEVSTKITGAIELKSSYDIILQIEVVLNRLPKTFKKSSTALKTLYSDSKVLMRLNNLTNPTLSLSNKTSLNKVSSSNSIIKKNALQQSLVRANKIAARSAFDVKEVKSATINQIEPKIQAAYGFADFGNIKNLNVDDFLSMDDGSYVTTHKIGYEEIDRYRKGDMSCDSFLFLSPLNHSDIQVNGDTNRSHISIKSNESLRVPIIYQYRMEDYNGHIFGKREYKSTDAIVKNTKYANIIGVDIWLNTLSDTPKQYDIIVYSTYNKDEYKSTGTITKKLK